MDTAISCTLGSEKHEYEIEGMDISESSIDSTSSRFSQGTSQGSGTNMAETLDDKMNFTAAHEAKRIGVMRVVTLAIIVLAGVAVSLTLYFTLSSQIASSSTEQYTIYAKSLNDASISHQLTIFEACKTLSDTLVSVAANMNQHFPNVTSGSVWGIAARHAMQEIGAESLYYMPLVSDVDSWNSYSNKQDCWNDSEVYNYNQSQLNHLYAVDDAGIHFLTGNQTLHLPLWMTFPPPSDVGYLNFDMSSLPWLGKIFPSLISLKSPVFSEVLHNSSLMGTVLKQHVARNNSVNVDDMGVTVGIDKPKVAVLYPVLSQQNHESASDLVGALTTIIPLERFLISTLAFDVNGITCVIENSCGQSFTYQVDGNTLLFVGPGDLHDTQFDGTRRETKLVNWNSSSEASGQCSYRMQVYTTSTYWTDAGNNSALTSTVIVACSFVLVLLSVVVYDLFVQRRQTKILDTAMRSHAMIASLFPSNVRGRLFGGEAADRKSVMASPSAKSIRPLKPSTVRGFLSHNSDDERRPECEGKPIADLFPETTVLFADIAGFTAWSSVREPSQVFILLETLYSAFDAIAHRRRVFKVETVGDCYVAATGLPEPRKDHAVAMARFARECLVQMKNITKRLEVTLGPGTGDLELRIGLHSGPVTAGVLRGERSRFQLFGDTMNTASRMETTGDRGKIHITEDMAELLRLAGKERWVKRRLDRVVAKGKGEMQTYWLTVHYSDKDSQAGSSALGSDQDLEEFTTSTPRIAVTEERMTRLIEWNVEILLRFLKQVEARRQLLISRNPNRKADADETAIETVSHMVIDEVREIITLPDENFSEAIKGSEHSVSLHPAVHEELKDFVTNIAALYNDNPFHNYEHASHVAMSVVKLLSRIVAPSEDECGEGRKTLHDHTYGITSDPLTQFACVLAALIHDVDHQGVPNSQLIKEHAGLARHYNERSVAEQNSMDLAWRLLMDDAYRNLRKAIYTTSAGLARFRQLLVNSVIATDIFDADLKALRNARWNKAFSEEHKDEDPRDSLNRKATIVIEHLIQASDVSHTMQHWHIYRKWNERYFTECYKAYKEGRAEKDPSEGWYQGELGFFDFYIIPLAKKLKDCGVFGVSSDEYLNYAVRNRREWEERGREVVDEMVIQVQQMEWSKPAPESAPDLLLSL